MREGGVGCRRIYVVADARRSLTCVGVFSQHVHVDRDNDAGGTMDSCKREKNICRRGEDLLLKRMHVVQLHEFSYLRSSALYHGDRLALRHAKIDGAHIAAVDGDRVSFVCVGQSFPQASFLH